MKIGIIGGGFTGLTLAYYLSKEHEVTVFEKNSYLGGFASAVEVNGASIERYYHHIFKYETSVQRLIAELGLSDRLIWHSSRVGMYWDGKFFPFGTPMDLMLMPGLSIFEKLRLGLFTLYVPRIRDWRKLESIRAEEWLIRYLGQRTFNIIWKHLLIRKFGREHYHDVPASYVWERLGMRTTSKKNLLEKEKLGYIDGSFQIVVDELEKRIKENKGTIVMGSPAIKIEVVSGKVWGIAAGKKHHRLDAVISTVPLPIFLGLTDGLPKDFSERLRMIGYSGVCTLMLLHKKQISQFYWTNIHDLGCPFGLMVEHTNLMPSSQYGCHITYLSSYLPSASKDAFSMSPEQVYRQYVSYLGKMFEGFDDSQVLGYRLFSERYSNPVISLAYSEKIPPYKTPIKGLYIVERSQLSLLQQGTDNCVRLTHRFLNTCPFKSNKI